jgi:hypothetical protein
MPASAGPTAPVPTAASLGDGARPDPETPARLDIEITEEIKTRLRIRAPHPSSRVSLPVVSFFYADTV